MSSQSNRNCACARPNGAGVLAFVISFLLVQALAASARAQSKLEPQLLGDGAHTDPNGAFDNAGLVKDSHPATGAPLMPAPFDPALPPESLGFAGTTARVVAKPARVAPSL